MQAKLNKVIAHTNCQHCSMPLLNAYSYAKFCSRECQWTHKNRKRDTGFFKLHYSRKIIPEVERIKRIIDKATERQRGIFADFLLYRGGDVLSHHEIDYFVADYNTQGI